MRSCLSYSAFYVNKKNMYMSVKYRTTTFKCSALRSVQRKSGSHVANFLRKNNQEAKYIIRFLQLSARTIQIYRQDLLTFLKKQNRSFPPDNNSRPDPPRPHQQQFCFQPVDPSSVRGHEDSLLAARRCHLAAVRRWASVGRAARGRWGRDVAENPAVEHPPLGGPPQALAGASSGAAWGQAARASSRPPPVGRCGSRDERWASWERRDAPWSGFESCKDKDEGCTALVLDRTVIWRKRKDREKTRKPKESKARFVGMIEKLKWYFSSKS